MVRGRRDLEVRADNELDTSERSGTAPKSQQPKEFAPRSRRKGKQWQKRSARTKRHTKPYKNELSHPCQQPGSVSALS